MYNCYFQIPRGKTNRYVFVFYLVNSEYYSVKRKVLLGNAPYKIDRIYKVNINKINSFINTVVANVY